MSQHDAIFGLFAKDEASHVFKKLGQVAKGTAHDTTKLSESLDKMGAKSVSAANKEAAATAKLKIEQQKLNEMRAKGNVAQSNLMRQEEKVAAAMRASDAAILENERALNQLTSAEARAAFQTEKLHKGFLGMGGSVGFASGKLMSMFKYTAMAGIGIAGYKALEFGKDSIKQAGVLQEAQTKLATAYKTTGHSIEEFEKPVANLETRFRKLGFTDAVTKDSLAILTTSLKDPTKAINLMGTAADLARYKHIALADAALVVAKGAQGQLRPVRALAIDLPVAAAGALKLEKANAALAKAQANLAAVQARGNGASAKGAAHTEAIARAEQRLNGLLLKNNDPKQRTIAQQNAINAAQLRLNQLQSKGVGSSNDLAKAQKAVADAQKKVNDVASAGEEITKALGDAVKNQAVNATEDWTTRQLILNAELDHLKTNLGEKLLPKLVEWSKWLTDKGIPALENFGKWVKNHKGEVEVLAGTLAVLWATPKIEGLLGALSKLTTAFKGLAGAEAAAGAGSLFSLLGPALATAGVVGVGAFAANAYKNRNDKTAVVPKNSILTKAGTETKPSNSSNLGSNPLPTFSSLYGSKPVSVKPLTTANSGTTIQVTQHIAGSLVTEKQVADNVHNYIAQVMKRNGQNPKAIGK